jgi:hypothetical protein
MEPGESGLNPSSYVKYEIVLARLALDRALHGDGPWPQIRIVERF